MMFCILVYIVSSTGVSSSFGSKTVRTAHHVFLIALPLIYFVRFIVLLYVLVSFIKVCVCAVIPSCRMSALLIFQCGEFGHLSVSCKKSPVDPTNAGSAKRIDHGNVPDQEVEYIFDAFIVYLGAKFNCGYGDSTSVKGRLKASSLAALDFVLSAINERYRLPFSQFRSRCFLRNNMSSCKNPDFVAEVISELLHYGCIVERNLPPYRVSPLTVA